MKIIKKTMIILVVLWLVTFFINFYGFLTNQNPLCCLKAFDVSTEYYRNIVYNGLGYTINFGYSQIVPGEYGLRSKYLSILKKTIFKLNYKNIEGEIVKIGDNKIVLNRIKKMSTDKEGTFTVDFNEDTKIVTKVMYPINVSDLKVGSTILITYDEKNFNEKKETIIKPYLIMSLSKLDIPNEKIKAGQYDLNFGKYEYKNKDKTETYILNNDGTFFYTNGENTTTGEYGINANENPLSKEIDISIWFSGENGDFNLNNSGIIKENNKIGNFKYVEK